MAKKRTRTQDADAAAPASKRAAGGDADITFDRRTDATAPQEKVLVLCSRGITYRYVAATKPQQQLLHAVSGTGT